MSLRGCSGPQSATSWCALEHSGEIPSLSIPNQRRRRDRIPIRPHREGCAHDTTTTGQRRFLPGPYKTVRKQFRAVVVLRHCSALQARGAENITSIHATLIA